MRELLTLATYESFFIFDQVMYRQINGIAMSSQLCLILANVFSCHFEKQQVSESLDFVNYMNTKHPSIKFTSECETLSLSQMLKLHKAITNQLHQFFVRHCLVVFLPTFKVLCLLHTSLIQFALKFIVHFPFVLHMKNFIKKQCRGRTFSKRVNILNFLEINVLKHI